MELINATGRRKRAIARIYLQEGKGKILINNKDHKEYFSTKQLHNIVEQPLQLLGLEKKYDIKGNLDGGGYRGQAEALRLAISRALSKLDEENRIALRKNGFLTRDSRIIERKKPGQKKARKKFQFSKR